MKPARLVFTGDVLSRAEAILAEYPKRRSAVLPLLHLLQEEAGHVTRDGMREVAALVGISPAEVLGTASFYTMFKLEPTGKHLVSVCGGMSCLIMGSDTLYANLLAHYGVSDRETTPDGEFTFEEVECLAACGGAPALQVDYKFFEFVQPDEAVQLLEDIRRRGLDAVFEDVGSVRAPLPPLTPEEVLAGPAPVSPRPAAAPGEAG